MILPIFIWEKYMYATDFEYDGQYLSDYGFMICDPYDSSGVQRYAGGSKITFHKCKTNHGKKYNLGYAQYEECIHATITIIKNPAVCGKDNMQITNDEYRDLIRWLNRREFLKFQLLGGDEYDGETCYYEASFNIYKLEIYGVLYGLELSVETNAPFGYGQEQICKWTVKDSGKPYILANTSDELGLLYPSLSIEILADGDFTLHNQLSDCTMKIETCKKGETIFVDPENSRIESTMRKNICDAWNCEYFCIENDMNTRMNPITCSLPCKIELRYIPIIKNSIE